MIPESLPPDPPSSDEGRAGFQELVRRAFDEELSDEEFAGLQARLRESLEQRRLYLDYSALHMLLGQSFETAGDPFSFPADDDRRKPRRRLPTLPRAPLGAALRSRTVVGMAVSILALLVLAIGFKAAWWDDRPPAKQPIMAWVDGSDDPGASRALRAGDRVRSTTGRTAIRFQNGVQLTLSEDGDLEVLSGTKVCLHAGQIQADVGEWGQEFTVCTDSTDVIDLGTVFGVGVDPAGETDVVVFEGMVELSPRSKPRVSLPRSERNFNMGEAVRIQSNGERARIPMIWRDSADSHWSTDATFPGSSVIAGVSDNLSTASRPKFYAVVPGGFREDAKVYVDRPYEWNGLTAAGLPRELIGADYIRTFNDDKVQSDLEIVLTLAGPADVYVLIDRRYPTPAWLAADFVQTDFEVGIDLGATYGTGDEEVPPLGITVQRWLGAGPGKSVDVPVSVWKREVRNVREVRFGPVPTAALPPGRGNVYGIVVTPAKFDH